MTGNIDRLDVTYCEGWDPGERAPVGPLAPVVARERDRAGEQYAMVLSAGGRPRVLIEVAWRQDYCAVWLFDRLLRRMARFEFRRLAAGRMFLTQASEWRYESADQTEFDGSAWTRTRQISVNGQLMEMLRPSGAQGMLRQTIGEVRAEEYWKPVPAFGAWAGLAGLDPEVSPSAVLNELPGPDPAAARPPEQRPWRPPVPLQPAEPGVMFRPDARYALPEAGEATVEIHKAGRLHMPSGQLIAADPEWLDGDLVPFTATVAPGTYPVDLAVARLSSEPQYPRVAAARLTISDAEITGWELALRPGQDPRTLGDGQFFGFDVDSGMACFVDAAAVASLAEIIKAQPDALVRSDPAAAAEITSPDTGANLIAFASGWGDGSYPTWIGYGPGGNIACFIADMLVLHNVPQSP